MSKRLKTLLIFAVTVFIAGCSSARTIDVETKAIKIPATQEPYDLSVALEMNNAYRAARWRECHLAGCGENEYFFMFGPGLTANTESLARKCFSKVFVVPPGGKPAEVVDAILRPSIASMSRNPSVDYEGGIFAGGFDDVFRQISFTMAMEWVLMTPAGETIWADTLSATATSMHGSSGHVGNREDRLLEAMDSVFKQTYQAIMSSEEIAAYVAKRRKIADETGEARFPQAQL